MAPFIIRQASSGLEENRNDAVFSVCAVFLFLSSTGFAARMVSKRVKRSQLLIDDLLIIWAYMLCVGETGMFIWGKAHKSSGLSDLVDDESITAVKYAGFGRHLVTLSKDQIVSFEKVFYSASLMQPCLLAASKLSILMLLYRVFITKAFRTTVLVLMAIVASWWISITFAGAFVCSPVRSRWNPNVPGHCGNQYLLNVIDPIPWILTDFAILFAPMPMVWKLHMPTRQKVALGGLFLIGGLTCIVSCVRYRYTFFSLADPTWDSVNLANWNVIEANVTVLCVCLIASKPVFTLIIPDNLFSRIASYFSRSFETLGNRNEGSRGIAPDRGNSGSRTHLPKSGAWFELQGTPESLHREGTKTSHEARNGAMSDEAQLPSRSKYGAIAV